MKVQTLWTKRSDMTADPHINMKHKFLSLKISFVYNQNTPQHHVHGIYILTKHKEVKKPKAESRFRRDLTLLKLSPQ